MHLLLGAPSAGVADERHGIIPGGGVGSSFEMWLGDEVSDCLLNVAPRCTLTAKRVDASTSATTFAIAFA